MYIWQNIEVMKIKMAFNRLAAAERSLMMERNRYIFEIESLRRIDAIEKQSGERRLKKITRDDFIVLSVNGNNEKQKAK